MPQFNALRLSLCSSLSVIVHRRWGQNWVMGPFTSPFSGLVIIFYSLDIVSDFRSTVVSSHPTSPLAHYCSASATCGAVIVSLLPDGDRARRELQPKLGAAPYVRAQSGAYQWSGHC